MPIRVFLQIIKKVDEILWLREQIWKYTYVNSVIAFLKIVKEIWKQKLHHLRAQVVPVGTYKRIIKTGMHVKFKTQLLQIPHISFN